MGYTVEPYVPRNGDDARAIENMYSAAYELFRGTATESDPVFEAWVRHNYPEYLAWALWALGNSRQEYIGNGYKRLLLGGVEVYTVDTEITFPAHHCPIVRLIMEKADRVIRDTHPGSIQHA